ncbi:hypothetical protein CKO28_23470 [Rhodovibrio sodomensis]|uniref:Uncharacterized protein n=1 Tax=Rhodovibrio sodomensis TaxID=1088 RepID=A0ABS1DKF9_9PROT|nr:hypothetical protein [Rhodovibrio sodomensis]
MPAILADRSRQGETASPLRRGDEDTATGTYATKRAACTLVDLGDLSRAPPLNPTAADAGGSTPIAPIAGGPSGW